MRKVKIVLMVLAAMVVASASIWATRAECAWCPRIACFGPGGCGQDCVCITPPGSMRGDCYSIE